MRRRAVCRRRYPLAVLGYHRRMQEAFDIVIIGGGLVGSSLAIALDGCGYRVALVEAALARLDAQPSFDERNLALARASINALVELGVWAHAASAATPIRRIHVSRRGDFGAVRFDADALGLPGFGAVLPARELGAALHRRLDACRDLVRIAPAQLVALNGTDSSIEATLREVDRQRMISTRLLVGADGTASFVREHFRIGTQVTDYAQSAFVTTVATSKPLDGLAYERFTDSGPIALLPLPRNRAGLIVSVPSADTSRIAALDDEAFLAVVHDRFGYRAGRLSRPGARTPYPLKRTLADALTAPRMVLVGNAAQTVHPLGAQGFNLGLRDALTLAELIETAARAEGDPGAADLLAEHVRRRHPDRAATTAFSDDLVRLMGNDFEPLALLRTFGFAALDRLSPLKRRMALRGMGFRGDVTRRALSR